MIPPRTNAALKEWEVVCHVLADGRQTLLSWDCVASRFNYRNRPGVHVMVLRVYRRPAPVRVENTPEYDGCVSWVDLEDSLETAGCVPVLSDAEFEGRRTEIRAQLAGAGTVVQA